MPSTQLRRSVLQARGPEKWTRAQARFDYFLSRFVHLDDRGGVKFKPWRWQVELAAELPRIRYLIILKARQIGMTWIFSAYGLWVALRPGSKCLCVSQGEDEAKDFLAKSQFIFENLPAEAQPPHKALTEALIFPRERSFIRAMPSTAKAGRSVSAARLVMLDEFSNHMRAADVMSAIAPSVESNPDGQLFVFSTANGVGNGYHAQWTAATQRRGWVEPYYDEALGEFTFGDRLKRAVDETGPGEWLALFLPYNVRPGRDEAWYERERESATYHASPKKFYQEFPRHVDEAFIQTGRPVFDLADLRKQEPWLRDPLPVDQWPEAFRTGRIRFDPRELRVFEAPKQGAVYYAGADVAEGLEHGDYSDLSVFDKATDREVLSLHGHWPPDVFAALIDQVARVYPGLYGIERNNHGLTVLTECDKHLHTPGIYREQAQFDPRTGAELSPGKLGWVTNSVTKPIMVDELEIALRLGSIHLSDALALPELTYYQTFEDGSTGAPAGMHDDRVISRAIAWQMRKQRGKRQMKVT